MLKPPGLTIVEKMRKEVLTRTNHHGSLRHDEYVPAEYLGHFHVRSFTRPSTTSIGKGENYETSKAS